MIESGFFFNFLKKNKIDFFCGVPDSVLKAADSQLSKLKKKNNIISHNEGGSIATAVGYYLSTKKIAAVYLQNSGLGNAINPISSIASEKVYSIPMLLIIGWRGSPMDNQKDEPQHLLKGQITTKLLKLLKIKYCVLNSNRDLTKLKKLLTISKRKKRIVACLIRQKKLTHGQNKKIKKKGFSKSNILRSDILKHLVQVKSRSLKIFSTTGYTSRELYQIRKTYGSKEVDFYNVGGMGHTASIALGYSLHSKKNILCIDGDGSLLMHMGSLANNGVYASKNFKHMILNNYQHESVGGQKTSSNLLNFEKISKGCGYKKYFYSNRLSDFKTKFKKFINFTGPCFFEVSIEAGTIKNLARPKNLNKLIKNF